MVANPIPVDETRSLAYRDGADVHIVVQLTDPEALEGDMVVRFRHENRKFRRSATLVANEGGSTLTVTAPAKRLGRVPWLMSLQTSDGEPFLRVQARVLAHPGLPVALLPGPAPRGQLAPPEPPQRPTDTVTTALRPARRVAGRLKRKLRGGKKG